ncbi:hypothetical protein [Streptomyces sp. NPDC093105]|uniref:hypothetical protein n=1 Tax=Streptomyces sp. NPDC093105 TaxID=3366029 RepID=UPI0038062917
MSTRDPYRSGWRLRVVPALGRLPVRMITNGMVDRKQAEDELLNPRALALPDREALVELADALVAASYGGYKGCGDMVLFAARTAARIGEVSGCRSGT